MERVWGAWGGVGAASPLWISPPGKLGSFNPKNISPLSTWKKRKIRIERIYIQVKYQIRTTSSLIRSGAVSLILTGVGAIKDIYLILD